MEQKARGAWEEIPRNTNRQDMILVMQVTFENYEWLKNIIISFPSFKKRFSIVKEILHYSSLKQWLLGCFFLGASAQRLLLGKGR